VKHSIQRSDGEVLRLDTSQEWRYLIIAYLKDWVLPSDKIKAQKLQHLATSYILLGDIMYKKPFSKLYFDPYFWDDILHSA